MRTSNDSEPDRRLAAGVLERDEAAFRQLYRRHTPGIYQFVLRTLRGDEFEAKDVLQETWIRAVERLDTFRWKSSLRTWLIAIAFNLCRKVFAARDRDWLEVDERDSVPETAFHLKLDLESALQQLPDGYRSVLLLHDLEGYRHADIADMLDISPGTSKSQLFRARRMIRSLLDPNLMAEEV